MGRFRTSLVLDNGLFVSEVFGKLAGLSIVRPGDADSFRILTADVVVVPFHYSQVDLMRLKPTFIKFVRQGGILVFLGAVGDFGQDCYPDFSISMFPSPYPTEAILGPAGCTDFNWDHQILTGISNSGALKYHGAYLSHGTITSKSDSYQATVVVRDAEEPKLPILLVNRWPGGGSQLITTLDPDHHSCSGVPGPNHESNKETRNKALILRNNILKWTVSEWDRMPIYRIAWRKLRTLTLKLFKLALSFALYGSALILIGMWLGAKYGESDTEIDWTMMLVGVLGVLKLLMYWIERVKGWFGWGQ